MRALRYVLLVLGFVWAAGIESASGQPPSLEPFFGTYEGVSLYPREEAKARELKMGIRPANEGGFIVEWQTTFYKFRKEPRRKTQALEFRPTEPGAVTFVAVPSPESTGMLPARDPLSGAPYAWARLLGTLLTVNVLTIAENGDWVMQTYDRALTRDGMGLTFVRVRNGEIQQRLWASLNRVDE